MESAENLAHLDRESGRKQTLKTHSEDVENMCADYAGKIGLHTLGRLVGLFHDCGKASAEFQNYLRAGNVSLHGRIPHSFCGARYLSEIWGNGTEPVALLTAELAAAAICAHHSGMPDVTGTDAEDGLADRERPGSSPDYRQTADCFLGEIRKSGLEEQFASAQKETAVLCEKLRKLSAKQPPEAQKRSFCFLLGLAQRFLLSCLVDADRYDTYLFAAGGEPEDNGDPAVLWKGLAARLENHLKKYSSDSPINRSRREISNQCLRFSEHSCGIYRLSVPTGSGKTMASLRFALNCAAQSGKRHIFYIAPYKSILDQNAKEIRGALNLNDDAILLEHHSDVVTDGMEQDAAERRDLLVQRWDAGIILTTGAQFLNTLFDGRNSCVRRMHELADSVIILDEFQAFPVKCTDMLNDALNFLSAVCGCAVVLCTATQPQSEEIPVPLLPGSPEQMVHAAEEILAPFRRTHTVDLTGRGPLSAEQLADFAFERLCVCDNLLLVFNTKNAARSVFSALQKRMEELPPEEQTPLRFLCTDQCPQHRLDCIERIRESLSSKTPGGNRMICVSTQLIEAGVDLSFQCAVRSLAGLDSAAQTAGRCNRHGEVPCRDVFLVECAEENLTRLPEIRLAQQAARHVLQDYAANPAQFGNNVLSPEAVLRYYHYVYGLQKTQLDYPAGEKDDAMLSAPTSLFDLLSVNTPARSFCSEHSVPLPPHPMHQAYATAGRIFRVIADSGRSVIVPYGTGKEIIAALRSEPPLGEQLLLLRKAQRYSVSVFSNVREKLEALGALETLPESGAAVLDAEFYNETFGVTVQRAEMEFMED